eukprot:CAMPEP_0177191234 /NCGR_PEP_ID=MMETSP0367-20130122/21245_1 /TAXON_ID=447022 ORGANISM="Scrippsiella hangoei-like, Strain SHHI-4" /NCGR_SAMPLE_ID=MMETSP0367 /ASSEMBLY_ACC=CAM_ASM_000362 /LENGTH=254 /DNA_ID=CAMNT_0018638929 /DNA_START=62 /DNA_END=826 /DNA_ORIENTATION=+
MRHLCAVLAFSAALMFCGPSCFSPSTRLTGRVAMRSKTLVDDEGFKYVRFIEDVADLAGPAQSKVPAVEAPEAAASRAELLATAHVGVVKAYSTKLGFGFIECAATFEHCKYDVYLHQNQAETISAGLVKVGDIVSFRVELNAKGRPQARDVDMVAEASEAPAASAAVSAAAPSTTLSLWFKGIMRSYSTEKGFGFIVCEEATTMFGQDVFLHKRQVKDGGLRNGDTVTFVVELKENGQPQARDVEKVFLSPAP